MSFQKAKQTLTRSPEASERILDQIPAETKAELVRKLSDKSKRREPRLGLTYICTYIIRLPTY